MPSQIVAEAVFVGATLAAAAAFKPLAMLRHGQLHHPWLAALVLLPWGWSGATASFGVVLQISGACLLVLMLGWPLACWSLLPVAAAGAWIGQHGAPEALHALAWYGMAPAWLALLAGAAIRRWLPRHLFVYILGRGFFATALAVTATGALHALVSEAPYGLQVSDMLIGHWLLGWGEAMTTGMLVATMAVFRPQWLATYSERQYLSR